MIKKLVMLLFLILVTNSSSFGGYPQLYISERNRSYDFGEIGIGQELEHVFKIENRGTENLVISKVSGSCGCTAAILENDTIVPGGTGAINLQYNTLRRTGAKNELITLVTNDPKHRVYRLAISGFVRADLDYSPDRITLRTPVRAESKHTLTLTNLSLQSPKIRVVKVESTNPQFIKADVHEGQDFAKRQVTRITISWKAGYTIGKVDEKIKVHTTSEISPVITIPIVGEVTGNFRVLPENVHFGVLHKGDKREKTVKIKFFDPDAGEIIGVVSSRSDGMLSWTVKNKEDYMKESTIEITLQAHEKGRYDNRLSIRTNLDKHSEIYIPIGAYVID